MTTYNTNNPVPSVDVRDLYDNAQNLDSLVNGPLPAYADRLGVSRKSYKGMEQDFSAFLAASGFELPAIAYVNGSPLVVARPTQLIDRDGILYSVKPSEAFPATLTGAWAADQERVTVRVGADFRQINETFLVPSQFATIQAALAEVSRLRYSIGVTVDIRLEAGYQIPSGIAILNSDFRNVLISSIDPVVTLAAGFVGVTGTGDKFAEGAIIYGSNSVMPRLNCLIDAQDVGGPGYCVQNRSSGYVSGACGVINAGKFGIYVANGSECIAVNSNFSLANWGNRVTTNSTLHAPQINCSGAKLQNYEGANVVAAMDVSRGSLVYVTGSPGAETNLTNSAGRGLAVRRSFVSATHVDTSGAALDGIRATTGAWIAANGAKSNNCLVDNISCYASWIDGSDSVVATGAGRYGLLVQDGGKANFRGANFSGALGGRGVSVVQGASATINGANCRRNGVSDQSTDIFVSDGSIIHAAGALGGTNITPLTLNTAGLIFK